MCLQNYSGKKIATENIVCYKVLVKNKDGKLRSCFYRHEWVFGTEYEEKETITDFYEIGKGAFHSYKNLQDAIDNYNIVRGSWALMGGDIDEIIVVECIIPKGTEYYYGYTLDEEPSYASKKIKIIGQKF